ncbi:MAG TPA: hypothetical protein DER10_10265 [Elusimicrobia bacterium]|nr:hypothetical protein [Elusimicrobiota bacterium]HCE98866.1 hypothetical protein [Elusimicrobiota bacterium]
MGIAKLIGAISKKKVVGQKLGPVVKTGEGRAILDHPQQGEKISAPRYTFRIGAVGAIERVELSVNEGPWQPCRNSVGYWWYDWADYAAGRYQAAVRAQTKDGQVFTSEPCKFQVVSGTANKQPRAPKANP